METPERRRGRENVRTAVEIARKRLRHGLRLEAAELLDRCHGLLHAYRIDDPEIAERRAYAHDRSTGNGRTSLGPEVLQRVIAWGARCRWNGRTSLGPEVLQRVIAWVTAEELAAGEQALDDGKPVAAARCFAAADRIDPRGTRAALLHAQALQRVALRTINRGATGGPFEDPERLQRAERYLRRATALTTRAAADPELMYRSGVLATTIDQYLTAVVARRSEATRMSSACACLVDYDAVVNHYQDIRYRTAEDTTSFRSSLTALAGRVHRLRAGSAPASAEARLLTNLADGIADLQRRLAA